MEGVAGVEPASGPTGRFWPLPTPSLRHLSHQETVFPFPHSPTRHFLFRPSPPS